MSPLSRNPAARDGTVNRCRRRGHVGGLRRHIVGRDRGGGKAQAVPGRQPGCRQAGCVPSATGRGGKSRSGAAGSRERRSPGRRPVRPGRCRPARSCHRAPGCPDLGRAAWRCSLRPAAARPVARARARAPMGGPDGPEGFRGEPTPGRGGFGAGATAGPAGTARGAAISPRRWCPASRRRAASWRRPAVRHPARGRRQAANPARWRRVRRLGRVQQRPGRDWPAVGPPLFMLAPRTSPGRLGTGPVPPRSHDQEQHHQQHDQHARAGHDVADQRVRQPPAACPGCHGHGRRPGCTGRGLAGPGDAGGEGDCPGRVHGAVPVAGLAPAAMSDRVPRTAAVVTAALPVRDWRT